MVPIEHWYDAKTVRSRKKPGSLALMLYKKMKTTKWDLPLAIMSIYRKKHFRVRAGSRRAYFSSGRYKLIGECSGCDKMLHTSRHSTRQEHGLKRCKVYELLDDLCSRLYAEDADSFQVVLDTALADGWLQCVLGLPDAGIKDLWELLQEFEPYLKEAEREGWFVWGTSTGRWTSGQSNLQQIMRVQEVKHPFFDIAHTYLPADARISLDVHDQVGIEVPRELVGAVLEFLKEGVGMSRRINIPFAKPSSGKVQLMSNLIKEQAEEKKP